MFIYVPIIWQLDVFVFGSTRQKKDWLRIYPLRKSRCLTIHSGVDTAKFALSRTGLNKAAARHQLGLSDCSLAIVMFAQFRVEKAQVDLISAANKLLDTGEGIQILLVGAGDMEDVIKKRLLNMACLIEWYLVVYWMT